jgi:DNA-binding MarR family transcriptional regulator
MFNNRTYIAGTNRKRGPTYHAELTAGRQMDREDIRTLHIIEELENNNSITQRELARKLDISLGLTNLFIKRIIRKGIFKVKTIPRHRIKYILTPSGIVEKTRLTLQYLNYSLDYYNRLKVHLKRSLKDLEDQDVRKIVLFGDGEIAELLFLFLKETQIRLLAVIEDGRQGKETFYDVPVISVEALEGLSFDRAMITRIENAQEGVDVLVKVGVPRNKIITISPLPG